VFVRRTLLVIRKLSLSLPLPVSVPDKDNVGVKESDVVAVIVPTVVPSAAPPVKLLPERDNPVIDGSPPEVMVMGTFTGGLVVANAGVRRNNIARMANHWLASSVTFSTVPPAEATPGPEGLTIRLLPDMA
jgi:hypothetical protein